MIRFAQWSEFDEGWCPVFPCQRMKMRQAFNIPLAAEVVDMLALLPHRGKRTCSQARASGVMHANAVRALLHGMGHTDIAGHDFRSSFRDWANERILPGYASWRLRMMSKPEPRPLIPRSALSAPGLDS